MADVTYKLSAEEGKAVQAFLKVVDAQKKVENGAKKVARATKQSSTALQRVGSNSVRQLKGMVVGWVSVTGAIRVATLALQKHYEERDKKASATKSFEKSFTDLLSLGQNAKRASLIRHEVFSFAKKYAVNEQEVASGRYALESMTAWATPKKREKMMKQMGQMRRITSVPMADSAQLLGKMGGFYQNLSAQKLSNLALYSIEKGAIKTPQELAQVMPTMMAAGKVGRMDATTAAAVGSYMTSKTGTAARAGGAMDIMTRKIMLTDPDEQEAIRTLAFGKKKPTAGREALMKEAGIKEADNAYERFLKIGERHKRKALTTQELKDLFGERGVKYGAGLLGDVEGLKKMVADFKEATHEDRSLTGEKI